VLLNEQLSFLQLHFKLAIVSLVKVSVGFSIFLLFSTFSLFFAVYSCDNQLSFSFVSLSSAHAYSVELLVCHRGEFWMHLSANLEH
jgi:hypothetical protein